MESLKKSKREKVINKQNAIWNISSRRSERRNVQTIQIRKSKRNQLLAVKRRLQNPKTSDVPVSNVGTDPTHYSDQQREVTKNPANAQQLRSTCIQYCEIINSNNANSQVKGSASLLSWIQSYISRMDSNVDAISSLLLPNTPSHNNHDDISSSLAVQFAMCLSKTLSNPTFFSYEEQLDASRILTNLAATESPSQLTSASSQEDYYGRPTLQNLGWCDILLRANALAALLHPMPAFAQTLKSMTNTHTNILPSQLQSLFQTTSFQQALLLCEQCSWAIGNLAGDSKEARKEATIKGTIDPLVQCLTFSFQLRSILNYSNQTDAKHVLIKNAIFGLCRNSAWAISNMARGASTSALPFISFFKSQDIANILLASDVFTTSIQEQPIEISEIGSFTSATKTNWLEVVYETCWILAFLTAREHEAVYELCSVTESKDKGSIICKALARCFATVTNLIISNPSSSSNNMSLDTNSIETNQSFAVRIFIPCIRAIGNIGTACDGVFVPYLIATLSEVNQAIPQSIASLLQYSISPSSISRKHDIDTLIPEALWAVGTLLCDMPHYSRFENTILPISDMELSQSLSTLLIPTICNILTSPRSTFQLKKEAGSTLWNAVAPSPNLASSILTNSTNVDISFSKTILQQISQTEGMLSSLVQILSIPDADVVLISLRLINIMIRQLDNKELITRLEEENIADKLEIICDNASCEYYGQQKSTNMDNTHTYPKSADIAADLIDDFFSDEYLDQEEYENDTKNDSTNLGSIFDAAGTSSSSNTFSFGLPPTELCAFESSSEPNLGRGRGRGANKPAWMT